MVNGRDLRFLIVPALAALALLSSPASSRAADGPLKKGPVKVFILAGQSNMEGHAAESTLDHLGGDPNYTPVLARVKKKDGTAVVRDDVWVEYLGKKGNLTTGFGVNNTAGKFGPELGFGINVGDYLDNQVLLIKACWGGHNLYGHYRSPSSGKPAYDTGKWPKAEDVGVSYRKMVSITRDVVKNLKTLFPDYDEAKGYEIAGFLWFQGFNDQFDPNAIAEYEQNMVNLIKDLRKEFNVPNMPVVIGELGAGGKRGPIALAQEAAAKHPEFKGTVRSVNTAQYWDFEAAKLMPFWNKPGTPEQEKWVKVGSNRPYHYMGSGKCMLQMGNAMGEAMVELLKQQK